MHIPLTLLLKILTVDSLKEDQVITEEETIDLLDSTRHALLGRILWENYTVLLRLRLATSMFVTDVDSEMCW